MPIVISPEGKYRHEIKLLLQKADYVTARSRLSAVMKRDEHSGGEYFIRSLYFDDIRNSSYHEKLAGVFHRKKFRMRTYNMSDELIKLEIKEKRGDRIKKTDVSVSRECAEKLIGGDCSGLYSLDSPVAADYLHEWTAKGLRPSVVVDYQREAYVDPIGNVRITFDKGLRTGISGADIFSGDLLTVPIFPRGEIILEVKYDELIPLHLSQLVSSVHGAKLAVSKFALCREAVNRYKPFTLSIGGKV